MNKLILTFLGAAHEQFYDDILRDLEARLLIALAARIAGEPEAGAAPLAPVMMDALAWGQRLDEAMGFSPYEPEDPLI